jgi:phosphoglycerate dehydrogenase-like enzyme
VLAGQGNYSHGLAEHTIAACLWFAKDLPRYKRQQEAKEWHPYNVEYLRWGKCRTVPAALHACTHRGDDRKVACHPAI